MYASVPPRVLITTSPGPASPRVATIPSPSPPPSHSLDTRRVLPAAADIVARPMGSSESFADSPRPAGEVWALLGDPATWPKWNPNTKEVRFDRSEEHTFE